MMKLKVTKTGLADGRGKAVKVGTIIDIEGDTIPPSLLNKVQIVGTSKGAENAVTNPAQELTAEGIERQKLLQKVAADLAPDKMNQNGTPKVAAVNAELEADAHFTAAEITDLWETGE